MAYFADFVNFSLSNKVWKIAVASKHPLQSAFKAMFILMLLTETFYNCCC